MSHREEWEEDGPPSALSAQEDRAASARPDTDCFSFQKEEMDTCQWQKHHVFLAFLT